MGLDLQDDYDKAKSKVRALKTTVETKTKKTLQRKEKATTSYDKKKSDTIKQISELENKTKDFISKQKNEIKDLKKNQLEQLLELLQTTFPPSENKSLDSVRRIFLEVCRNN